MLWWVLPRVANPWRRSELLPDSVAVDAVSPRIALGDGLGAAEVHAHTLSSDGMVSPEELVSAAAAIGISVLCITDHDTMASCARARLAGADLGIDVVSGQEVTSALPAGIHVVGLFLEQPVRMGMSLEDTVDAIHDQNGLAVLAHPFMPTYFASISERRARLLLERRAVDAIELRHTAVMTPRGHRRLDAFYAEHRSRVGAALGGRLPLRTTRPRPRGHRVSRAHRGRLPAGRRRAAHLAAAGRVVRSAAPVDAAGPAAALAPVAAGGAAGGAGRRRGGAGRGGGRAGRGLRGRAGPVGTIGCRARLAQLVEQGTLNPLVTGSSPVAGTANP